MPDKWEYPWFAAWDMAFHCVALAMIDPDFAKDQLLLLMREWYMHPNGQIPAYEWALRRRQSAGACLGGDPRLPDRGRRSTAARDRAFLERVFQKLLINFTWWVNRKDARATTSSRAASSGSTTSASSTASQGCLRAASSSRRTARAGWRCIASTCWRIALELAREDAVYEDIATKFFEHFVYIGAAINRMGGRAGGLWDDDDGFYFDALKLAGRPLLSDPRADGRRA